MPILFETPSTTDPLRTGLRYLDREGRSINESRWRQCYHDPEYSIIHRSRVGTHEIVTSWLGVAWGRERTPEIFLVQVLQHYWSGFGKNRRDQIEEKALHWLADEASALAKHRQLEKDVTCSKA